MQKVAYFISSLDPGGAETLVVELGKRIRQHGFEPEILHFGNEWLEQEARKAGLTCVEAPAFRHFRATKTLPFFALKFSRFLAERHVDLVHSHLYGAIVAASLATALKAIPHIGTLHDTYTIEEKPSRFLLLQVASLLRTRLVVVSEHMRKCFDNVANWYRPLLLKVFNGVDLDRFRLSSTAHLRQSLGFGPDDVILISVGRLVGIKRYDVLVDAVARLKGNTPLKLLIVGDGPCRHDLLDLIVRYGLQEDVRILGYRDDIPKLLSLSDCFVLASDSEGLSYSILESMAAGIPAVVTDVGGNGELVQQSESGYLVPRRNPFTLSERIRETISDRDNCRRLGEAARRRAMQYFSIDRTVEQYAALYREALGGPRRST
jgi:glycosyltransferase involved in cell wall biosynthesis